MADLLAGDFDFVGRSAQGAVEKLRRHTVAIDRIGTYFAVVVTILFETHEFLPILDIDRGQLPVRHRAIQAALGNFLAEDDKAGQVLDLAAIDILGRPVPGQGDTYRRPILPLNS